MNRMNWVEIEGLNELGKNKYINPLDQREGDKIN